MRREEPIELPHNEHVSLAEPESRSRSIVANPPRPPEAFSRYNPTHRHHFKAATWVAVS